jgi:hypothetical protein
MIFIWGGLAILFVLLFADLRRPFRLLNLDLLALLACGSIYLVMWEERANYYDDRAAVVLMGITLGYLALRMLSLGFRGFAEATGFPRQVPLPWLATGVVLLLVLRLALVTVIDPKPPVDVGQTTVIGAHRIATGQSLYDARAWRQIAEGYGPVAYLAYLPFERALPWDGRLPGDFAAARAAAIAFDLLTTLALFLLGSRLRFGREGRLLGLTLALAWLAYPYTLFAMRWGFNDALVALLIISVLAVRSAPARGFFAALAAATKFSPAALVPLFATRGDRSLRSLLLFGLAFAAVTVAVFAPFMPHGGIAEIYDRTLGYRAATHGGIPSFWPRFPQLDWLQVISRAAAAGLALAVALPKRRSVTQMAALGAAVLIAFQLTLDNWFINYILWFAPLVLVGLFATVAPRRDEKEWLFASGTSRGTGDPSDGRG